MAWISGSNASFVMLNMTHVVRPVDQHCPAMKTCLGHFVKGEASQESSLSITVKAFPNVTESSI